MEKEIKEVVRQLEQKLDVIAALLLRLVPKDIKGLSLRDQVGLLDGLGVRPIEISKIIGRPQNYVSKELVSIRLKQK